MGPTVSCPACRTEVKFTTEDLLERRPKPCPKCGQAVSASPAGGPENVDFPKVKMDETCLDLSDAVREIREASQKKKRK